MSPPVHIKLRHDPINADELLQLVSLNGVGGVVYFSGNIRPEEGDQTIDAMAYEAYESMAVKELEKLAAETSERWPVFALAAEHRLGDIPVSEAAVGVAVGCAHRREAFEACQYFIDTLKQRVPIWKKSAAGPGKSEAAMAMSQPGEIVAGDGATGKDNA
jgi:molybdopterin synthase catalytic subunit